VKKGIQGKIEGPDKLRPGELGVFEVKLITKILKYHMGLMMVILQGSYQPEQ